MNKEFFEALELLQKEKGIEPSYMIEKIEAALKTACAKEYSATAQFRVDINPEKKDIKVYRQMKVVEEVEDPEAQISLAEAKAISKRYDIGSDVETEIKTKNVRRLSANAAKNVIIQAIREGERMAMQRAYENKKEEIITATVLKVDSETGAAILETGTSTVVLPKNEQIPGEEFHVGDRVKVYVCEVNRESRGPLVTLSRSHAGLVRRMFELEIPEIVDGTVLVRGIAREAGSRTKISVESRDPGVDPVGACIGNHGMRIASIIDELRGEKVDVVQYDEDPVKYVAAALAPAKVISVEMTGEKACKVIVDPAQQSLAIGRQGQNARLVARLTGHKVDIKTE
ncbi:MAG: transcription termination/antitermination protein NusA [Clostridia bacterium]|nr:transcription termination/antitermination protein NusA [Clostridia bacterium]